MHVKHAAPVPVRTAKATPPVVNGLLLDDSVFDRKLIQRLCRNSPLNIHLEEVEQLECLPAMLDRMEFDIIFADYNLPVGNGLDALTLIRNSSRNAMSPVVLITGEDQSAVAVKAMKTGCADYVTKDALTVERLNSIVQTTIMETSDARRQRQSEAEAYIALNKTIHSEMAQHLQPDMAALVRNLRRLCDATKTSGSDLTHELNALERQGIDLWSKLMTLPD